MALLTGLPGLKYKSASDSDSASASSLEPVCYGNSRETAKHRHAPLIYGRSFMSCTPPATSQTMVAQLIRCDTWMWFICLDPSIEQYLDDGRNVGAGSWQIPTGKVYYVSETLEPGWYRVETTHGVFWPTGQEVGVSAGPWIQID